jgi:hypothetical protein
MEQSGRNLFPDNASAWGKGLLSRRVITFAWKVSPGSTDPDFQISSILDRYN